ncbi:MAG: insulinase family protein [Desulfobacteraceae bacterium]|nr:MAG: insulinase family protein [Desulfobacteraceae bacterium]
MNKILGSWLYLVVVFCLLPGCLGQSPVTVQSSAPTPVFTTLEGTIQDPRVVAGMLPNGFGYILVKNPIPEKRIRMHLNIFAGSVHETDEQQGLAHYLEHMLFNGSTHFKPGELVEYFQSIGMDFGADANAHTGFYNTVYDLDLPDNSAQSIRDALLVFDDYARGALLFPSEIEREKGIILAEMRDRDSVSYRTLKASLAFELPGSILNQRHPIGIASTIKTADQRILKAYYDQWYRPDNMVLVMVGDFDVQLVTTLIQARFNDFEPRTDDFLKMPENRWTAHTGVKAFYHFEPEAGDTDITIETISRSAFEPETAADLKQDITKRLGNMILNQRFSKILRQEDPSFSDAGAYSGTFLRHITMSAVGCTNITSQWQASIATMENTLRQALLHGFHDAELDQAKRELLSGLDSRTKRAPTRKSKDIADELLDRMSNLELIISASQEQDLLKPFIETLTLKQVHASFVHAWSDNHRLITVTGHIPIEGKGGKSPESQILETFKLAQTQPVQPYPITEAKSFPYLTTADVLRPENQVSVLTDQVIEDLGVRQIKFDNHTCLNLKPTDFKKDEVNFKLVFGKGKQTEPEMLPGLSILSEQVLNDSGFGRLTQDELEQALAGRDIEYEFEIKENLFTLTGTAGANQIALIFDVIQTFILDPGIRENALVLAKKQYKESYRNMARTIEGVMQIKGEKILAGQDSRFGLPAPEGIDRITTDQIRAWLLPYFKTSPVELSLVGDFIPEEVIPLGRKVLGTIGQRSKTYRSAGQRQSPALPLDKRFDLRVDTKIEKSMVRLVFPTVDYWDIALTRRLVVLSRLFSERLRIQVREKLGAAYSPYVYNDSSLAYDDYGLMHAVVTVAPDQAEQIAMELKSIADSLAREGVTERELDLVKKPLMTHLGELKKRNQYWLHSVMAGSFFYPQKFEWARSFPQAYGSVTKQDMDHLAKVYLDTDKTVLMLLGPEKE